MLCENCHEEVADSASSCPNCGHPFGGRIPCPACRARVPPGGFCDQCGASLGGSTDADEGAPPGQPDMRSPQWAAERVPEIHRTSVTPQRPAIEPMSFARQASSVLAGTGAPDATTGEHLTGVDTGVLGSQAAKPGGVTPAGGERSKPEQAAVAEGQDRTEEPGDEGAYPESQRIVLETNINKRYFAEAGELRYQNLLDFSITNNTRQTIGPITVRISSASGVIFGEEYVRERTLQQQLGPRQSCPFSFDCVPQGIGEARPSLHVRVTVEGADAPEYFRSREDALRVFVLPYTERGDAHCPVSVSVQESYGCDQSIVIENQQRAQDLQEKIRRGEPCWQIIDLEPDLLGPEHWQDAEPGPKAKGFKLAEATRPHVIDRLKLVMGTGEEQRKIFIFAKDWLYLGRDAEADREKTDGQHIKNDIMVRRLPITPNSDNFRRTVNVSKTHAGLQLRPDGLYMEDWSKKGTELTGTKVLPGQPVRLPDKCGIKIADALDLCVQVFRRGLEEEFEVQGDERDAKRAGSLLGMEQRGPIDAVHITRTDNASQHEYVWVLRQAVMGCDDDYPIALCGPGTTDRYANLVRYRNAFFLHKLEPHVNVSIDGHDLSEEDLYPLAPGCEITIGTIVMKCEDIREEDFKRL